MVRVQEYFHLLDQDYQMLNQARDNVLRERLDAEIAKAAGELAGLNEVMNTAKTAYDTFEVELQALKDARAALDTDTTATQTQKDDADAAITAK